MQMQLTRPTPTEARNSRTHAWGSWALPHCAERVPPRSRLPRARAAAPAIVHARTHARPSLKLHARDIVKEDVTRPTRLLHACRRRPGREE